MFLYLQSIFTEINQPIRVVKNRKKKQRPNLFNEPGIPDPQTDFKMLFRNTSGNNIQRTTKPRRKQGDYDPRFSALKFDPLKHDSLMQKDLKIG